MKTPLARILIVDDEPLFLYTTAELLRKEGYQCTVATDATSALAELRSGRFDLMLSDLHMPGNLQGELLNAQRAGWPQTPLIVITGVPSLPTAIESLRLGVTDYLLKPVRFEELLASVRKALNRPEPNSPLYKTGESPLACLLGSSPAIQRVRETSERAAVTDSPILITGEHGVGKHFLAKLIHNASRYRHEPLTHLRCINSTASTALNSTSSPAASSSLKQEILFGLDESKPLYLSSIESLPRDVQNELLLQLQQPALNHSRRPRLLSGTMADLQKLAQDGGFSAELYYRLAVIQIDLPPLRERGDDVEMLARHFLQEYSLQANLHRELDDEVLGLLFQYPWPGNVHELKNAIYHAATTSAGAIIKASDLPPVVSAFSQKSTASRFSSRHKTLENAERSYLVKLLRDKQGNVAQSAREAGLSRQGLHKMLARHGLNPKDFRQGAPTKQAGG